MNQKKLVSFIALFSAVCFPGSGEAAESAEIRTVTGRVYKNATVSRVLPDGIVISHAGGMATVPFADLPEETRERYGYDPEAAARSVQERRAAQAARMQAEAERREHAQAMTEQSATAAQEGAPRIVTAAQMKNYWLNTFPQPNSLDRDFHQKKREYEELMELIRSGKLDNEAQRQALARNIAECQKAGDLARAASFQADLRTLEEKIAEEERARQAAQLQHEIRMLNHAVQQLNTARMMGW